MKTRRIEIKTTDDIFKRISEKADQNGFTSITDFVVFCCMNAKFNCRIGADDEKQLPDIKFAFMMLKDGMISQKEFDRIKSVLIEKLEKSSVWCP